MNDCAPVIRITTGADCFCASPEFMGGDDKVPWNRNRMSFTTIPLGKSLDATTAVNSARCVCHIDPHF